MGRLEELVEIAHSEHPHCATVLLLDTSGSMAERGKIDHLNEGIRSFKEGLMSDDLAKKSVDLAVVTFGGSVQITHDFSPVEAFEPPALTADGQTPMGEAILKAIELAETRKQQYKTQGVDYYRPWIFMITDGEPTDMNPGDTKWEEVVKEVHGGDEKRKFLFFSVGVEPANFEKLRQIAPPKRSPAQLQGVKFKELFSWLRDSLALVSRSKVGEQVELPPASGWMQVEA